MSAGRATAGSTVGRLAEAQGAPPLMPGVHALGTGEAGCRSRLAAAASGRQLPNQVGSCRGRLAAAEAPACMLEMHGRPGAVPHPDPAQARVPASPGIVAEPCLMTGAGCPHHGFLDDGCQQPAAAGWTIARAGWLRQGTTVNNAGR
jgi:hypothetical protein